MLYFSAPFPEDSFRLLDQMWRLLTAANLQERRKSFCCECLVRLSIWFIKIKIMRNVSVSFSNVSLCQFHIKQDDIGEVWLFMKTITKSLNVLICQINTKISKMFIKIKTIITLKKLVIKFVLEELQSKSSNYYHNSCWEFQSTYWQTF